MKHKLFIIIYFFTFAHLFSTGIESDVQNQIDYFSISDWSYNIYKTSDGFYHVVLNLNFDPFIDTEEIKYIDDSIRSYFQENDIKYLMNIYRKYRVRILETDPEIIQNVINDMQRKLEVLFQHEEYNILHELDNGSTNIYIYINPYVDFDFDFDTVMNK